MKKALLNASVASMIYKFNMNNIALLQQLGYKVDVACNFGKENPISKEEISNFEKILEEKNISKIEISCPRSIFAIKQMVCTYREMKQLAEKETYDLVHTQSPIGGVICRLAFRKARKRGTKIIYQAHGFHFYKGAPIINWILFYPIEKICSYFTDILITINNEDYVLSKNKLKAKINRYVPGVGIDLANYQVKYENIEEKRLEIGVPSNSKLILSVGELTTRKNHENLIKAVAEIEDVFLIIAGKGELEEYLKKIIQKLGIVNRVKLIGFRTDVLELCYTCDLFAFPSYQEGLPVALMEAMACGRPVVCSRIRGNTDLIGEGKGGFTFNPNDVEEIKGSMVRALNSDLLGFGKYNYNKIKKYGIDRVKKIMGDIYVSC